jgi:NAD(P)-dependent dehydrogenase (short-subunit alcohol dehydrogenase family)
VADEIAAAGGVAIADTSDIADAAGANSVAARALEAFGRVDVVIANAGIDMTVRTADVTDELMERFFAVHVQGTRRLVAAAWPHMLAQHYGRVITTTSSAGYFGLPYALPYSCAKGALHAFTQTLAMEGRSHGITVNAVAPFAASRLAAARSTRAPTLAATLAQRAPASAVAPVVVWLAHESTTITGASYEAGGGAVSRVVVGQTSPLCMPPGLLTPEHLAASETKLSTTDDAIVPELGGAQRPLAAWILRDADSRPKQPGNGR